jgi:hypothetical protein
MIPAVQLPMQDLFTAMEQANVVQIMANERRTEVTVDYIPARDAMAIPREKNGKPVEAYPIQPIKLTFRLEDAMFGGDTYAAIVCGNRVVVAPFYWSGYDKLASAKFTATHR